MFLIKVSAMSESREEIIDKTIESEINWLRNGFKVLIMAYWKKDFGWANSSQETIRLKVSAASGEVR